MDTRIHSLEDLCQLLTMQIVTQNQNFINTNANLVNEIRGLKDIIKKQDDDFVELKTIVKNIEKTSERVSKEKCKCYQIPKADTVVAAVPQQQQQQQPVVVPTVTDKKVESFKFSANNVDTIKPAPPQPAFGSGNLSFAPAATQPSSVPATPPKLDFGSKLSIQSQLQQTTPKEAQSAKTIDFTGLSTKNLPTFADLAKSSPSQPMFGGLTTGTVTTSPSPFGSLTTGKPTTASPMFGGVKPQQPLFGLQQQQAPTPLFGGLQTSVTPLFGGQVPKTGEDEEGGDEGNVNPEEYEPNVNFQPLVQLAEVEVKTGEEDEEVLFKERCKLYRFSAETKEWKEKGVGEMKVLKHRAHGTYRILMRRDQVLKLCANHRITADLKLEIVNEKQVRWSAQDYSEPEAKYEILTAKFRHEDEAKRFIAQVEKAKVSLPKEQPSGEPKPKPTVAPIVPTGKPLSEVFKKDTNAWSCPTCLVNNPENQFSCSCCQTAKPGAPPTQQQQTQSVESTKPTTTEKKGDLFKFGTSGADAGKPPVFAFGNLNFGATAKPDPCSVQSTPPKPAFAAKPSVQSKPQPQPTTPKEAQPAKALDFSAAFGSKNLSSFADLAKGSPSQPMFGGLSTASPFGGITTGAAPSSPFGGAIFGGGAKAAPTTAAPLFGGQVPKTGEDEEGGDEGNANPEEYEPNVDFKPLVQLAAVEVKTGEEEEEVLFKERCKLYRFSAETKEWKEKGVGEMKVLKHRDNGTYRILMRRDQVLKLCANHRITADLKLEIVNEKQVRWSAQDYSEPEAKYEILTAKFRHEDEAKRFKAEVEKAQKDNETRVQTPDRSKQPAPPQPLLKEGVKPLSELFKKNDKSWSCPTCLVQNTETQVKCSCCQTAKPGSELDGVKICTPDTTAKPQNAGIFGQHAFGTQPQTNATPAKFEFGTSFNLPTQATAAAPGQVDFTSLGNKNLSSFADLAKGSPLQSIFGTATAPSPFGMPQAGGGLFGNLNKPATPLFGAQTATPLFGGQVPKTGEDEEGGEDGNVNPEEYEPNVDFKPLVQLAAVEVKTGEEDEEVLFKERCKLYRFSAETKEWKEKGVGEMKVLKHRAHGTYRILMRRDQVLKLCANHRVTPDLKFEIANEKQVRWTAQDYSEPESKYEILAARFRHEEEAKRFKEIVEKAQKDYVESGSPVKQPPKPVTTTTSGPSLSSLVKKEAGSWSCTQCLAQNKPNTNKCACCEHEREDATSVPSNDVCVVEEVKASPDQVRKAKQYQLPENFYLYENKPECAGCRGCTREE